MQVTKQILILGLMVALAGCGSDSPSSPQPAPTPAPSVPVQLAVFTDSGFSTSDVRDVQGEVVRFDVANNTLIWGADGRSFAGYPVVEGSFIRANKQFQIRFGTASGERRAYFTETATGTLCDIFVSGGVLSITGTNTPVPGS